MVLEVAERLPGRVNSLAMATRRESTVQSGEQRSGKGKTSVAAFRNAQVLFSTISLFIACGVLLSRADGPTSPHNLIGALRQPVLNE